MPDCNSASKLLMHKTDDAHGNVKKGLALPLITVLLWSFWYVCHVAPYSKITHDVCYSWCIFYAEQRLTRILLLSMFYRVK